MSKVVWALLRPSTLLLLSFSVGALLLITVLPLAELLTLPLERYAPMPTLVT